MAARVIEIADALKDYIQTQLSAGVYGFSFNLTRKNPQFVHKVESTAATWVYVYPGPEGPTLGTRGKWQHTYNIVIHLVNYVDGIPAQDEIDDAALLMERIIDSIKEAQISGRTTMEFSTEDNPEEPYVDDSCFRRCARWP